MLSGLQGGKGGFFSLYFVCPAVCAAMQSCCLMAKAKGTRLLSKCSWGGTGVGAKARGWTDEPNPWPAAKAILLKWSTDGRTPNVHRESHSEACDVHLHIGTVKPCSPLLWIPLDQKAVHIRLYFNSCLTLPMHLKHSKKKAFKALISCFLWKMYPKTC